MTENNSRPLISVVIPTFNRVKYLELALKSLTEQTISKNEFEVIVINDGSTDNTIELCNKFKSRLTLKCFTIENSGISSAKNLGLFSSAAPICFFFDDDDVAHKNLLKEHIAYHQKYPEENVAILGYTTWSSKINVSYLMHYITDIGYNLFYYKDFKNEKQLDYTFFWGGRCSCKKSFLVKNGAFNQGFKFGSEDIELGYRMKKFGLKVIYNANAKSYMIRPLTFEQFCRRCEKQGKSLDHFLRLHPTDEVEKYAGVQQAQGKWNFVKEFLEDNVKKVNELEDKLNYQLTAKESQTIKDELNRLYSWVFEAYKIKGYLDEYNVQEKLLKEEVGTHLYNYPQNEIDYIKQKHNDAHVSRRRKKNILVIDPLLPMYDRASGSLRLFQVLRSLLELDYHITYIARNDAYKEQYVPLLEEMGIEVHAGDPRAMYLDGDRYIKPQLEMTKILSSRKYDYALMSFWYIGEYYAPAIRKYSPETKIIVDSVDIHFVREVREAELKNDEKQKKEAFKRKENELKTYSEANEVWVITDYDKKVLEENGITKPIQIVPNIHDKISETKIFEQSSDLLFVGNFWHTPNVDAVKFFHKEVFPEILKEIPDIKLYIVGNHPTDEILKMKSENVIVTGFVEDTAPYLRQARISIAPLRYGAGMKGKIGEALSWGLPVVTTSIGAEGMNLINNETAVITDDSNEFAKAIVKIYNDKMLWEKLSYNGKQHVEKNWSYEAILGKINEIFSQNVKTSIITLTYNGLEFTEKFYESLLHSGIDDYELIIIDNASTDETSQYLKQISSQNEKVKVISNDMNLGFPAAVNQGIIASKGKYIVVANNDIVFTKGWLNRLMEIANDDNKIGLVGPISNEVSGLQVDKKAKYNSLMEMHNYADKIRVTNQGEIFNFPRIAFLCTLIKKEVIEKIGGLDERFTPGNYEDDDFCLRAQLAGYKTVIAKDVFIHHFGSKSFKANGEQKYAERLEINKNKFIDKWGVTPDELWLLNKEIKPHQVYYPINKNHFIQYFQRARVYIADQEFSFALEALMLALKYYKSSEKRELPISENDLLNLAGNIALINNDLETARICFEKELSLMPTSSFACIGLGELFLAQSLNENAKTMFEWAVKNDPSNKNALELLCRVNLSLGFEEYHNSLN
jgi:GT2 family glycosyltransferase/glycosyltransferase involved in cell wall biosynthesis